MVRKIVLEVDGLRISGQLHLPENDRTPHTTVCVCHGIPAKNLELSERGYPLLAERICQAGLAVFIFNFRGTGTSDGDLDMLGWTRDLKAVINYLFTLPEVDKSRLYLLGFSAGAAVSISVASQDSRISGVVACACPARFNFLTDKPEPVIDHFRQIGVIREKDFPPSIEDWLNGFRLVSPLKYIAGIAPRPLLLMHGNRDDTVEVSQAYELYNEAKEPKQIAIVDGAGHRLRQDEQAMAIVIDWLKSQCTSRQF
jgi:alpha/beta superfamily hydrolase